MLLVKKERNNYLGKNICGKNMLQYIRKNIKLNHMLCKSGIYNDFLTKKSHILVWFKAKIFI